MTTTGGATHRPTWAAAPLAQENFLKSSAHSNDLDV